jgi:RNA polymerase sigma-70 factor (ECF subfamily)
VKLIHKIDKELTRLIASKSSDGEEAFKELYRRYSNRIFSYCLFKANSRENAEEIYQETWISFHNALKKGFEIDNVPAYLASIAANQFKQLLRKNYKSSISEIKYETYEWEQVVSSENFDINLENKELIEIIKIAVNSLEEKYSEPFILNKFNDMAYSEIADLLGLTSDCVKKRIYRAGDMIKKTLKPYIRELSENHKG